MNVVEIILAVVGIGAGLYGAFRNDVVVTALGVVAIGAAVLLPLIT